MSESNVSKYELYQQFAENRERSALRRVVPFGVTATVEIPSALITLSDAYRALAVIAEHPELNIVLGLAAVALMGTGAAAFFQQLDITRAVSPNGRLARQISQLEGRNPHTGSEINSEIEHVKRTVSIAGNISPTPGNLFDIAFNHHLAIFRSRAHPEALEERAIEDRKMRRWSLRYMGSGESIYPIDPQTVTDALLLAERRWGILIEDDRKPAYVKRYGVQMREEIKKKLSEHLTTPTYGEFERRRIKYENMSALELGQELQRLVKDFPVNSFNNCQRDNWELRDQSPEKKRLFEQLRHLISHSPSTRGFQEVLLRELGFLYNRGLDRGETGLSNMDSPLLNAIGLGGIGFESDLFNPEHCQELEQRLYKYVSDRDNNVFGIFRILIRTPLIEQSWKRQYKAKYHKKLKAA